jgi:3'-phosphoadenosine 5'-phosphosulfate sulfotransferase
VVAGDERELPPLDPGREQLGGPRELRRLAREREVARDDEVVDALLLERRQDLLQDLGRVAVAVPGAEAVPRVPRAVGEVKVADVAEPDDVNPRARAGEW